MKRITTLALILISTIVLAQQPGGPLTALTGVPNTRKITINGTQRDLSADRSWTVGDALVANPLSQFAATTSTQLASTISDETGTGPLVFASSPTFTNPTLGNANVTTINKVAVTSPASGSTLSIADGKVVTYSNSITFSGADNSNINFSNGGSIPFMTNYNRYYLKDWDAQIAKIMQAVASTNAIGICVGDSWTINGNTIQPIVAYLRTKFGDAGTGYFGAATLNQGNNFGTNGMNATLTRVGSWSNVSQNTYVMSAAIAADSTSTVGDSLYYVGKATDFVVHYMKKASGGSFVTRIDGTNPTTVTTSGSTSLNFSSTNLTGLTDATHTLSIKVSTAGQGVLICGAEINRNQNGVRIHNIGCSGSTATEWVRQDATNWQAAVTQLNPNIAFILLGVNDCAQNMTTTTYTNNLSTIVTRILTAKPNCAIVLISPGDIGIATTYSMSTYIDAAKDFALRNNYAYIDNYALLGPYTTANSRGLYTNTTHINAVGGQIVGENIKNWLMNGMSMYYSNGNNLSLGESSLLSANSTGTANVAIGTSAGQAITTGTANTLAGWNAGKVMTTAQGNTYMGFKAAILNTTGSNNTGFGTQVFAANVSGTDNSAFGKFALFNCTGSSNTGVGSAAGQGIGSGSFNTYVGAGTGVTASTANSNTGVGYSALDLSTGGSNTAIGHLSAFTLSSGTGNTFLGAHSGRYLNTQSNRIIINCGIDRTSLAKDTTDSPIVVLGSSTPSLQIFTANAKFSPTYGIIGTTSTVSPATGIIGERIQTTIAPASEVTFTTATAMNIATLSLTAGDWDVAGQVTFDENLSTVTARQAGITVTSSTIPTDGTEGNCGVQSTATSEKNTITLSPITIRVSTTTTVYLVGSCTFSAGTAKGYGFIKGTRIR